MSERREKFPQVSFRLPEWVEKSLQADNGIYPSIEERMRLVIKLSSLNITYGSGGPFAAAIFDQNSQRLVAPGVNLVLSTRYSTAHAEIIAIMIAQRILGHYNLGGIGMPSLELVSSAEPCAMCIGAITWSGIRRVVCGAREEDIQKIGFDEGPKLSNWENDLKNRGINVIRDVLREEAARIIFQYLEGGGIIYNGGRE